MSSHHHRSPHHSHSITETTPPAASSSHMVTPAPPSATKALAKASASNPLECFMKDLKCGICLSIASKPKSLPCNHFFCERCLQELMNKQQASARDKTKEKKQQIRPQIICPECRQEFNRRTIVDDNVVQTIARLCAQLNLQPDVKELRTEDDSIFDMSQATPFQSPAGPHAPVTRSNSGLGSLAPSVFDFDSQLPPPLALPTTATKRKLPTSLGFDSSLTSTHPGRRSAGHLHPPSFPANDEPSSSSQEQAPPAKRPKHTAHATPGSAAAASRTERKDPSPARPSAPSSSRPARAAALHRRSYRDPETQMEEWGASTEEQDESMRGEEGEEDDCGSDSEQENDTSRSHSTPARKVARQSHNDMMDTDSPPASAYKHIKNYPPIQLEPDACAVCGEETDEEAVVECKECGVKVHPQLCYGSTVATLTAKERENWYCDRCSPEMGTKKVTCCVCPNTDDQAFKKTDKGTWMHASCATWLSGPNWRDPAKRNLVTDINKIPKDRFSVPCKFCTGKGAIIQCQYGHGEASQCRVAYHVPCGVRFGILYELRGPDEPSQETQQLTEDQDENDDVFFHSYCKKHQPMRDSVPNCNSAVSHSARKKKQRKRRAAQQKKRKRETKGKGGKKKGGQESAGEEDEEERCEDTSSSDMEHESKRSKRHHEDRVNRSINLADTSLDTSMDTSTDQTPVRQRSADLRFRALFNPPSASPFTTPLAQSVAAMSGVSPATSVSSTDKPAARKLAFSPPSANQTTAVGVSTRSSPHKVFPPVPLYRSASAGELTSSQASALKPILSRLSSLRNSNMNALEPPAAAAASSSRAQPAAAGASSSTPSTGRVPLRSMPREEVSSRDSQTRNSSASPSPIIPKMRAGTRRQIVLLGTKLDPEQQALLEELASTLNAVAASKEKDKFSAEKFAIVQHHFDSNVTHVITTATASEKFILQTRTMKYFQGLLSGAWVLGVDWVSASLCERKPMPETNYLVEGDAKLDGELTHGARRARNQPGLFKGLNFVWGGAVTRRGNANKSIASEKEILQLIKLGGGTVADALPGLGADAPRRRSANAHDSDLDDGESQLDDFPSSGSSPSKSHRPAAASILPAGRWFLLVDDSGYRRHQLKSLKSLVAGVDWEHCKQYHIDIVGVNWLIDTISAFKLQPVEKLS